MLVSTDFTEMGPTHSNDLTRFSGFQDLKGLLMRINFLMQIRVCTLAQMKIGFFLFYAWN